MRQAFRSLVTAGVVAAGVLGCGADAPGQGDEVSAQTTPEQAEEQAFDLTAMGYDRGEAEAPIQIIEFSDYGCVHCQSFHRETFPALQEEFVEEGKVVWKYIPISIAGFPNSEEAARAAHCAGEQDRFFDLSPVIYRDAPAWTEAADPRPVLVRLGEEAGLQMDAFEACLDEERGLNQVREDSRFASEIGVRGTPTFVVNGMPVQGAPALEDFRNALNQMLDEIEAGGS